MSPATGPGLHEEVVEALLAAGRALVGVAARSIADLDEDVTLPQFRALVVLATRGPQRVVDICAELGVASSTGTRLCARLARKQLVRRDRSGADRRAVVLSLTPRGRVLVDEVTARRRAELDRVVAAVPEAWHGPLISALGAFTAASGDAVRGQWWLGWQEPVGPSGEPAGEPVGSAAEQG